MIFLFSFIFLFLFTAIVGIAYENSVSVKPMKQTQLENRIIDLKTNIALATMKVKNNVSSTSNGLSGL